MKMFLLCIVLAGVTGCVSSVDFLPYQGAQQEWPTEPGAFVDTKNYALPVYHGRPARLYNVLGSIEVEDTAAFTSASSAVGDAVTEAKKRGAAAVILLSKSGEHREGRARAKVIAITWR